MILQSWVAVGVCLWGVAGCVEHAEGSGSRTSGSDRRWPRGGSVAVGWPLAASAGDRDFRLDEPMAYHLLEGVDLAEVAEEWALWVEKAMPPLEDDDDVEIAGALEASCRMTWLPQVAEESTLYEFSVDADEGLTKLKSAYYAFLAERDLASDEKEDAFSVYVREVPKVLGKRTVALGRGPEAACEIAGHGFCLWRGIRKTSGHAVHRCVGESTKIFQRSKLFLPNYRTLGSASFDGNQPSDRHAFECLFSHLPADQAKKVRTERIVRVVPSNATAKATGMATLVRTSRSEPEEIKRADSWVAALTSDLSVARGAECSPVIDRRLLVEALVTYASHEKVLRELRNVMLAIREAAAHESSNASRVVELKNAHLLAARITSLIRENYVQRSQVFGLTELNELYNVMYRDCLEHVPKVKQLATPQKAATCFSVLAYGIRSRKQKEKVEVVAAGSSDTDNNGNDDVKGEYEEEKKFFASAAYQNFLLAAQRQYLWAERHSSSQLVLPPPVAALVVSHFTQKWVRLLGGFLAARCACGRKSGGEDPVVPGTLKSPRGGTRVGFSRERRPCNCTSFKFENITQTLRSFLEPLAFQKDFIQAVYQGVEDEFNSPLYKDFQVHFQPNSKQSSKPSSKQKSTPSSKRRSSCDQNVSGVCIRSASSPASLNSNPPVPPPRRHRRRNADPPSAAVLKA